jgi:hypothetical protein
MARARLPICVLLALAALTTALPAAGVAAPARAASTCRVLSAPRSLGATLLTLHRAYMAHQPDVHNPRITGPVGPVHLGVCGTTTWALTAFDARYNGVNFGETDQPERFSRAAGKGWVDLGNTGGDPCDAAPPTLILDWKLVTRCP